MFPDNWAIGWLKSAGLLGVTLVVAGLTSVASTARAEDAAVLATGWQTAHASRVRLIGGGIFDGAGSSTRARAAAIEMTLDPQWKTYWRMPGESGVPPQFDFAKSSNVATAEVLYPAPLRFTDKSGDAVGYKTRVVFPIRVVPHDPSKPVSLTVELAFGVCKDICVPLETQFVLDLPPSSAAAPPLIRTALDEVPRVATAVRGADPVIHTVSGSIVGGLRQIEVAVKMPQGATGPVDLFVEAPEGLFVPMAKKSATRGETSIFLVDFSKLTDAKDLVGKALRFTAVSADGASETTWTAQ
jgi:DsbC/DsbD-like thiol-disulfide interchange protein